MDRYEALEILRICSESCSKGFAPVAPVILEKLHMLHAKALDVLLEDKVNVCEAKENVAPEPKDEVIDFQGYVDRLWLIGEEEAKKQEEEEPIILAFLFGKEG